MGRSRPIPRGGGRSRRRCVRHPESVLHDGTQDAELRPADALDTSQHHHARSHLPHASDRAAAVHLRLLAQSHRVCRLPDRRLLGPTGRLSRPPLRHDQRARHAARPDRRQTAAVRDADSHLLDDATPDDSRRRQSGLRDQMVGELPPLGRPAAGGAGGAHHGLPVLREAPRHRDSRDGRRQTEGGGAEHLHRRDDRVVRLEGCHRADAPGRGLPQLLGSIPRLVRRHHAGGRDRADRLFPPRLPLPLPDTSQSRQVKLEVVTIGTELLLGQILDTNAAELGRGLAAAGVEVVRHSSVADRPDAIRAAVAEALERTGFVITTGGLGRTRDEITKREVAAIFNKPLVLDAVVLQSLEERFRRLGRTMPAVNRTQAEVPEGATVLPNPRGTAPGLWLEDRGRVVVMLPGVPSEMRGLLAEEVLPRLAQRAPGTVVRSRTVRTTGIAESALAERVGPIETEIAPLTLAYLPSTEGVELRVTAWGVREDEADRRLAAAADRLRQGAGEHFYGEDGTDLAAVVLDLLRARSARLVVAESCTGGLVSGRITAVAGASDVFIGAVVAYDNVVKSGMLDVPPELLETHGAVSEAVVRAMAEGVQRQFAVDAAIAVTGIAGPTGGTPEKPVGTVWLAARYGSETRALKRIFPGDRAEIRARAAQAALDLLRRLLAGLQ